MSVASLQLASKILGGEDNYALAQMVVCAFGLVLHFICSVSLCAEREPLRRLGAANLTD